MPLDVLPPGSVVGDDGVLPSPPHVVVPPPVKPPVPDVKLPDSYAPTESGEWKVVKLEHGWLRYSKVHQRLDCHCGTHPGCKMDRSLRKGNIGLAVLWLRSLGGDKEDHAINKKLLSLSDKQVDRQRGRDEYKLEMESRGCPLMKAIWDHERELRSNNDEPTYIP